MANRQGLAFLDCDSGMLEDVAAHAIDFSRAVLNDGKCDSRGRFWVGSMDREIAAPSGALYRVDPDLSVTMMDEGLTLSNGIAWSPDERTMLFCDSRPGRIWAYDYEIADGSISNRRVFVDFEGRKGRPDGCTIDADGGLWVAEIGAGQVVRFDPSGRQDVAIPVPTSRPTSVTFGGHDLRTLYVTSMRHGLSDEEVACQPDAGHVFAIDLDVSGLAAALFAG